MGEPEDSREDYNGHERDGDKAKRHDRGVTTGCFEGIGGTREEKGIPGDILLVVAVVVVKGDRETDTGHDGHDQMIRFGFDIEGNRDNEFNGEHEDALPPAEMTHGEEIVVLIREGASCRERGQARYEFEPGFVGDFGNEETSGWGKVIAQDREESRGTEEEDQNRQHSRILLKIHSG